MFNLNIINMKILIQKSKNPIIIITWAESHEKDIISLNIWMKNYSTLQYSPDVIISKLTSLIKENFKINNTPIIRYKKLKYNIESKSLTNNKIKIELTANETKLVELLLINKAKLVTKSMLINYIWGEYNLTKISDNNINVTISKIRKKLWSSFNLKTLINQWYILEETKK